jgi:hypothetical protein
LSDYHEPEGQDGVLPPSRFGAGYSVGPAADGNRPPRYVVPANPSSPAPAYLPPPAPTPSYPGSPSPVEAYSGLRYPNPVPAPVATQGPMAVPGYPVTPAPMMYYVAPQRTNSMAIAALVCSLVFAPLGIIFGHIALAQINRTREEGRGMAIAGLVIGYLFTGFLVLYLGLVGAFFASLV